MTTTRLIARWDSGDNAPATEVVRAVAGDYAGDFDLSAATQDYLLAINDLLPDGLSLAVNGDVYGPADYSGEVNIRALTESVDVGEILARFEFPHVVFNHDHEMVIEHRGEDADLFITPDGHTLPTVIAIPASTEWEPARYDAALTAAGWRRVSDWINHDIDATAKVAPIERQGR
jgi:hypothetical protein